MDYHHHHHHHMNSTYLFQQKSMDEMRQSVLLSMELQQTRLRAEEDLKARDDQIFHLRELLAAAIKDRDQAQLNLKKAFFHNIPLHHSAPDSGISTIDCDPRRGGIDAFSSSDCDESIASSPQRIPPPPPEPEFPVPIKGPLPEKGQLLQAVMKAGPLLQTLLLAGPLPQWRHPPPPLDPCQIPPPPVVVPPSPHFLYQDSNTNSVNEWPGRIGRKRGLPDDSDWSDESKHQRVAYLG